jgi:YVTN family beta-propeller protein
VEFKLLGPIEVRIGGAVVPVDGAKQRALLALLLLHANEVVSRDRLIDELWGEVRTPGAGHRLETQVSRLRKTLELNGQLVGGRGGYALAVDPMRIDAYRFERMLEEGRSAAATGLTAEAAQTLREALALWRGGALADLAYERFARSEIERLEELRVAAIEERVDLELALGRHREVVAELDALAAKNPLRERLRAQLMLALYRSGRQGEALEAYQEYRRDLSEELGLEPGPGLQQLELAILHRDPALTPPHSPAAPSALEADAAKAARPEPRSRLRVLLAGVVLAALAATAALIATTGGGPATETLIAGDSVGAIGPSGRLAGPSVALGSSPSVLAAGAGAIWTANYNSGTVSRVDPHTHAVVETIPGVLTPSGLAVAANDVWVTDSFAGTVSRIDPTVDQVVQTIPVGNAPTGAAAGNGSVWVVNSNDGTLTRIDPSSGEVLATIALGAGATSVATGLGGVWVSDAAGDRVFRVDPQTDHVTAAINVGTGPTGLAVGYGSVWVANSLDGTVSRIDPQTNTITATVNAGDGAGAVAIGDGGVWVSSQYAGTVSRIDPVSDAVVRTVRVGNRPQGLAVAAGLVWVGMRTAANGHRGGTLRVVTGGQVDTVDPVLTQNLGAALPLTYDGLTSYQRVGGSGSLQLVPDLAVSLPSATDGGTTYTFELRRGIRFSDGELVRPEDFRRALERDLVLGGSSNYGGPFADVVGGAACAAHPSHCDLSRGVLTDDAVNTVTFHLLAPNPEFLERLALPDAAAVPPDTPLHDIGLHPLPATGPYQWVDVSRDAATLIRNKYFREWSHAARPDGYPDRIVFRHSDDAEATLTAVERGSADIDPYDQLLPQDRMREVQTRFASQLHIGPNGGTVAVLLNTRTPPFTDIRVRQAINYAIDRGKIAQILGQDSQPACQILPPGLPGYRPYCPYTIAPNPAGAWHAPDLSQAKRLIDVSRTRGTPITIWNLEDEAYGALDQYLVSLLDQLGYPTHIKDFSGADPNPPVRFADSRTGAQAAVYNIGGPPYPSTSGVLQGLACQTFVPDAPGNGNWSEFCNHRLDTQINNALAAESTNSPDTAALWAQADRTATDQAPAVPLTTTNDVHLVSALVGNYQYSFQLGVLLDQLWVR